MASHLPSKMLVETVYWHVHSWQFWLFGQKQVRGQWYLSSVPGRLNWNVETTMQHMEKKSADQNWFETGQEVTKKEANKAEQ